MGCSNSNSAAGSKTKKTEWEKIRSKLPRNKTPDELKKRDELFRRFDPNGNGFLTYAEVEKGATEVLGLHKVIPTEQLQAVLVRAFNTCKSARVAKGAAADDQNNFIERVEFRLLLVYIYDYFEMYVAFDEIDSSNDKKVSMEEFKKAVPQVRAWGVTVEDPEATFKTIDKDGNGSVTFTEFAEWAIQQHLNVDSEDQ
eukprot:GILI01020796.1.p1 GENE.GILI01020796.1~~GILI01020796.1.p1  ORF type:complete len:198 (-),score=35.96 GILI01020796.1:166-759(-)